MSKAILLLHGFLSDIHDFAVLEDFFETYYDHIERVSYPGHESRDYYLFHSKETIELVTQTFDKLKEKYDDIDVMGYSMGGALAVYLSTIREFHKLILLAPANKYFRFRLPFIRIKDSIERYIGTGDINKLPKEEKVEQYQQVAKAIRIDDKESFKFLVEKYFKMYILRAYIHFRRLIKECNTDLKEIKNPTFIAWGELDQLVPRKSVKHLCEYCMHEHTVLKIYPYLSHLMLNSSFREPLVKDIIAFIQKEQDKSNTKENKIEA